MISNGKNDNLATFKFSLPSCMLHGSCTSSCTNCNNHYRYILAIILQHISHTSVGCQNRWADFTCGTKKTTLFLGRTKLNWSTFLQIPWWLLVAFGSYCLWSIGLGLVSLKECPEAYNELLGVSFQVLLPLFHINFAIPRYLTILKLPRFILFFSSRKSQKRKMIWEQRGWQWIER